MWSILSQKLVNATEARDCVEPRTMLVFVDGGGFGEFHAASDD